MTQAVIKLYYKSASEQLRDLLETEQFGHSFQRCHLVTTAKRTIRNGDRPFALEINDLFIHLVPIMAHNGLPPTLSF